jgi:methylmalonyl-CoA mutase, N-terminal domain
MGGAVSAIEQGFMQEEIARSAYLYQQQIERKEKIIVGVNKFTQTEKQNIPGFKISDSIREKQIAQLQKIKSERNAGEAKQSLLVLEAKAKSGENIMQSVVDAVEKYVTLGEIADSLRNVFGEYA